MYDTIIEMRSRSGFIGNIGVIGVCSSRKDLFLYISSSGQSWANAIYSLTRDWGEEIVVVIVVGGRLRPVSKYANQLQTIPPNRRRRRDEAPAGHQYFIFEMFFEFYVVANVIFF